jgi:hypothetical protein
MSDAPHNQAGAAAAQGQTKENIAPTSGPPPSAVSQQPPSNTENASTQEKRRWTNDPPMFWVTLAGVIAVIAYTSVAAWQAYLTRGQLNVMQGQLDAMERDQRPIVWITNNLAVPEFKLLPDNKTHVVWNFEYTNYGKSFAYDVRVDQFMLLEPGPFKRSSGGKRAAIGGDLPPGGTKSNWGSIVSEPIDRPDYERLLKIETGIVALLEFEYMDAIGKRYTAKICFGRLLTGAIINLSVELCENEKNKSPGLSESAVE